MPKRKDTFWEHAEDLKNGRFRCKYCKNDFPGGISRIKSHLSGLRGRDIKVCEQVPEDIKKAAGQELATLDKKAKHLGASNRMVESAKFTIPTSLSHNISNVCTEEHKLRVDKHLAKYFLSEGIHLEALQSPFFIDFVKGIAEYGPGYELPSFSSLKSQLIPDVSKEVTEYVENVKRSNTGCTLMYNIAARHLNEISPVYINSIDIFLYTSIGWAYLESCNQESDCLDTAKILAPIIESLGPKNIVQISRFEDGICIDYPPNVMLSREYPWIHFAYCASDVIGSLAFAICDCPSVETTIKIVHLVVSFIYKYDIKVPLRRANIKGGVRWDSYYMLKIVLEVEDELKSLQTLLSTDSMELHDKEQKELSTDSEELFEEKQYLTWAKLIGYVIHCEEFWTRAKAIAQILLPLFQTHCLVEGIGSTSGYLYEMMERVTDAIEKFCDSNSALYDDVWPVINEGREEIIYPMHAAAAFLNPAYMCSDNFKETDEMRSGIEYLLKFVVLEDEKKSFMEEFQQYRRKVSSLFTTQARMMLETSHPCIWWDYCGNHLPVLRKYALRLLSQPCGTTFFEQYKCMLDDFYNKNQTKDLQQAVNIHMMRRFKQLETQMLGPIILDKLGEVEYGELIDQPFCRNDSYIEDDVLNDSTVDEIINDKSFSWLDRFFYFF
ncbi:hypothetical protein CJ030_MR5G003603 [Morella rubra]|uniref:BED-type domain-containing protein n=1 Tax=Morella rubra TaxID=262757 RepID=A0A6A1VN07_9ROSI|nr:hypothetical protein CJ030_MR5G003603 [Morella rubra]